MCFRPTGLVQPAGTFMPAGMCEIPFQDSRAAVLGYLGGLEHNDLNVLAQHDVDLHPLK